MITPGEFSDRILDRMFRDVHYVQEHNWDDELYGAGGREWVRSFNTEVHREYLKFFWAEQRRFYHAYIRLEDAASRKIYEDLILYRLLGNMHVRLPTHTDAHWNTRLQAKEWMKGPATIQSDSLLGAFQRYHVPTQAGSPILFDGWWFNVAWAFGFDQWGHEKVCPKMGDVALDIGASYGDATLWLADKVGENGQVYAFEMLPQRLSVLRHNVALNPVLQQRIHVFGMGMGSASNNITDYPDITAMAGRDEVPDEDKWPMRTLDDLYQAGTFDHVDFIKMEIEGWEVQALAGAHTVLRTFKPALAISVDRRWINLFDTLLYLDKLDLGYRFYLDHYTIRFDGTVLYACAD